MKKIVKLSLWAAFLALLLFVTTCFKLIVTSGNSMNPTYTPGDTVLFIRAFRQPSEGDVILFQKGDMLLCKRISQIDETGFITVLGDNPDESWDSRAEDFGTVHITDIWGYPLLTLFDR